MTTVWQATLNLHPLPPPSFLFFLGEGVAGAWEPVWMGGWRFRLPSNSIWDQPVMAQALHNVSDWWLLSWSNRSPVKMNASNEAQLAHQSQSWPPDSGQRSTVQCSCIAERFKVVYQSLPGQMVRLKVILQRIHAVKVASIGTVFVFLLFFRSCRHRMNAVLC